MSEVHEGYYFIYLIEMESQNKEPLSFDDWLLEQTNNLKSRLAQ